MHSPTVLGTVPIPMLTAFLSLMENVLPDVLTDTSSSKWTMCDCGNNSLHLFFSYESGPLNGPLGIVRASMQCKQTVELN
ncbi:hypothetical protein SCHPADRAFT_585558 [Schizopora paradoxa]|uniref:Uncharacterized protein n=1 Tax=Schizopora paradoxa TaxID=27342 RepID=A0A0H2RAZ2_9AGAM|nr:hypothetical protein SCHPADRAFT_585558 [Schizopora paradoxa]